MIKKLKKMMDIIIISILVNKVNNLTVKILFKTDTIQIHLT